MLKYLTPILFLAISPALLAQEAPTPEQYKAAISALRAQRDAANDQAAQLAANLTIIQKEFSELKTIHENKKK